MLFSALNMPPVTLWSQEATEFGRALKLLLTSWKMSLALSSALPRHSKLSHCFVSVHVCPGLPFKTFKVSSTAHILVMEASPMPSRVPRTWGPQNKCLLLNECCQYVTMKSAVKVSSTPETIGNILLYKVGL